MLRKPLKAYEDVAFLKSESCRAIRLQLELLKADTVMTREGIESTIVVFGSARTPSPEKAQSELELAEQAQAAAPDDPAANKRLRRARSLLHESRYYRVAREFSRLVSETCQGGGSCRFVIITGGGGGIMEAGNRGAADVGAKSIGLNITLPFEQQPNEYITESLSFQFHYFSIRKMHFLMRAKALCAFPGGFGTMDELFETLTLIQTGKIGRIPVLLFGREFWDGLINWDSFLRRGLIDEDDLQLFQYCETAEEGWDCICAHYGCMDGAASSEL